MRAIALFFVFLSPAITSAADPLPPGAVLRLGETRFRANGEIRHLRFSTHGNELLGWAVGLDGQLHPAAWETATGVSIPPSEIHFPPDVPERTTPAARLSGDRVITAGPGCSGRVWDASSGKQLALLSGHSALVTAVAVSPDGKRIATGGADGLIKLWDADSFHPLAALDGHTGMVRSIRIAANSVRVLTAGDDHSARVWDLKTGKELRGFPSNGAVDLSPDGTAVVMAAGKSAVVRDVLTGLEIVPAHEMTRPSPTFTELLGRIGIAIAFSSDARMVAVGHRDGTIGLYEAASGQRRRLLAGHDSICRALAFTPDGSRLLSAGSDHSILVWAVRVQDLPLPETIQREQRAGKLWTMLTTGSAEEAYLAMARFAAEPPAAVKMAGMRLHAADNAETNSVERLADMRAVEMLESLGTTAAQELLEELAVGEPAAHRTQEAWRALWRLGKRR